MLGPRAAASRPWIHRNDRYYYGWYDELPGYHQSDQEIKVDRGGEMTGAHPKAERRYRPRTRHADRRPGTPMESGMTQTVVAGRAAGGDCTEA